MASKGESKTKTLEAYVSSAGIQLIDEAAMAQIGQALAPVSPTYLRKLVRAAGLPMSPLVEGVCQQTLADLERTLLALQNEYELASPADKRGCRAIVIAAKDHARWALRKPGVDAGKVLPKQEMLLWIMTWLENPSLFPAWVLIRKRTY